MFKMIFEHFQSDFCFSNYQSTPPQHITHFESAMKKYAKGRRMPFIQRFVVDVARTVGRPLRRMRLTVRGVRVRQYQMPRNGGWTAQMFQLDETADFQVIVDGVSCVVEIGHFEGRL